MSRHAVIGWVRCASAAVGLLASSSSLAAPPPQAPTSEVPPATVLVEPPEETSRVLRCSYAEAAAGEAPPAELVWCGEVVARLEGESPGSVTVVSPSDGCALRITWTLWEGNAPSAEVAWRIEGAEIVAVLPRRAITDRERFVLNNLRYLRNASDRSARARTECQVEGMRLGLDAFRWTLVVELGVEAPYPIIVADAERAGLPPPMDEASWRQRLDAFWRDVAAEGTKDEGSAP